jgi:hypothetical protein
MVLGFLLYESIDLAYNMGKITFNGITYTYNWYYGITPTDLNNKIKSDEIKLQMAQKKIHELEKRILALEDKKD